MLVLLSGLLVFFLLVVVHELGHYLAAVKCKVGVVRFSVGFGPALVRWKNERGTYFQIALIPLGGFVQMLDKDTDEQQKQSQDPGVKTFEDSTYWQKIGIIAAGPMINLLCAFLVLWSLQLGEKRELISQIAFVQPTSLAAQLQLQPGDILLKLDGESIQSQSLFRQQQQAFRQAKMLEVQRGSSIFQIPLPDYGQILPEESQKQLGIVFVAPVSLQVEQVSAGSSAEAMGVQKGDEIVALNGQKIANWVVFVREIESLANQDISLEVVRQGAIESLQGRLGSRIIAGETRGFLGVQPAREQSDALWLTIEQNPFEAFAAAFLETFSILQMTVSSLGSLFEDSSNLSQLMGPVGISQVAAETASVGLSSFLYFFALLNLALGTINLVPLPMLDGGQIVIHTLEKLMGKPLPTRLHHYLRLFSIFIILYLTFVALHNDFLRILQ